MIHIYRDGAHIETVADEFALMRFMHNRHSYSLDHAAKYEGYSFLDSDYNTIEV